MKWDLWPNSIKNPTKFVTNLFWALVRELEDGQEGSEQSSSYVIQDVEPELKLWIHVQLWMSSWAIWGTTRWMFVRLMGLCEVDVAIHHGAATRHGAPEILMSRLFMGLVKSWWDSPWGSQDLGVVTHHGARDISMSRFVIWCHEFSLVRDWMGLARSWCHNSSWASQNLVLQLV